MQKELERKIIHLLIGVVLAYLVLLFDTRKALVFFGVCIIGGVVLSELLRRKVRLPFVSWFVGRMERRGVRPGKGAIHFFLGTFIALAFFDAFFVFVSLLILGFGDSFSAIVGKGFGRVKLYRGKTLEGTLAGFLASFLVCLPYLPVNVAFAVCVAASFIELLAFVDDNLLIPPLASLIIYYTSKTLI